MKRDSKFNVPSLPDGKYMGVVVRRDTAWRGPKCSIDFFIATEPVRDFPIGSVFTINRDGVDLLSAWGSNDKTRRRWAQLAGVKFSEVQTALKARREAESSEEAQRQIQQAQQIARRYGYRMTKR